MPIEDNQLIQKAREFAARVHAGQTDKGGHPYIDHPLRVAAAVEAEGREAVIAALLPDVVEDGAVSPDAHLAEGFPTEAPARMETNQTSD